MEYVIELDIRPDICFNQFMSARSMIKRLSNGLLNTTTDLIIFQIALFGASFGKQRSPQGVNRMFEEAFIELEHFNHHTVRSAWSYLRRKGLISVVEDKLYYSWLITQMGKKRLTQLVPKYQTQRPWDKRLYIITYDIPEKHHHKRNSFRSFLKAINVVPLQQSVWITPYNPRSLIVAFVHEHEIDGSIIISDTGTNGSIGNESIGDLITRVYHLEELNNRYEDFLTSYKQLTPQKVVFKYLVILNDDPQLPFQLLPYWWKGDEAYGVYQKLTDKMRIV